MDDIFDIKIGTIIPANRAVQMIGQLNLLGFESYELTFDESWIYTDFSEFSKQIHEVLDGRKISALGMYGNTLTNRNVYEIIKKLILNSSKLDCNAIGAFAGGLPNLSVPDTIPEFKKVFAPLSDIAQSCGVKIGLEGCGGGWYNGSENIAFCSESWELIFNAVQNDSLGLEWEPCHMLMALANPITQLRRWAPKITHIHGKDASVAWDVIRNYGINGSHQYAWNRTPGFGDTNWADVFTILIQNNFHGSCDIEGYHDPVHFDDMEWTAQITALDYLKRCRGGISYVEGPSEYRGYQGKRN